MTKPPKILRLNLQHYTDPNTGQNRDQNGTPSGSTNREALRQNFVRDLFQGLKDCGFVVLSGHGLKTEFLNTCYHRAEQFFALPSDTKMQYLPQKGVGQRAYVPFGSEKAKDAAVADLKEYFHIGPELPAGHRFKALYPDNVWPEEVKGFKEALTGLYVGLEKVANTLLEALAPSLGVGGDFFKDMLFEGNHILRLLHYPPLIGTGLQEDSHQGAVRAAAHEDINLITLLVSASASGLELLTREGKWMAVESEEHDIIVDTGDMMARLTGGLLPSTTHRVVNPVGDAARRSRYSMPFFVHPHAEAWLEALDCAPKPQPPIRAQDFLLQRLRENGFTN